MSDQHGPPDSDTNAMALMGVLAVVSATAGVMGRRKKARFAANLHQIAEDWTREDSPPELRRAAEQLVRPAAMIVAPGAITPRRAA